MQASSLNTRLDPMHTHVLGMGKYLKVLDAIVESVAVDVVDMLRCCEAATKISFHHKTVLQYVPVAIPNAAVSTMVNRRASIPSVPAILRTESTLSLSRQPVECRLTPRTPATFARDTRVGRGIRRTIARLTAKSRQPARTTVELDATRLTGTVWGTINGHSGRLLDRLIGVSCLGLFHQRRGFALPQLYRNSGEFDAIVYVARRA